MAKNWRAALLLLLLAGPIVVYVGLGALWLREHGWLIHGSLIWIGIGVLFGLLAERWTREKRPVLPPIDWELPSTFSPHDRKAWEIVEVEASRGDDFPLEQLSNPDTYLDTGKRLAQCLAAHYQPDAQDPVEHVAIVDLMTALELAADDLGGLCRQIPGGDLITPSHWKRAVQMSGYLSRANDIYGYVMPLVQPWTGLVRLGTQQLMVKPAWKNMQQNLMRWFWRAYVNRLGTHLIELYSGRLTIGAEQYRRLTKRRGVQDSAAVEPLDHLTVALVGSTPADRERVRAAIDQGRAGSLAFLKNKTMAAGLDESIVDRLKTLEWVEVPAYPATVSKDSRREKKARGAAVEAAVEADVLILVIDGATEGHEGDVAFAREWENWFSTHPTFEHTPVLVVMTGADTADWGGPWSPPYDWNHPRRPREQAVQARAESIRGLLPAAFPAPIPVGIAAEPPFGLGELVLPALAISVHRAERPALIRRLNKLAHRSKARRLAEQIGAQGRRIWQGWGGAPAATNPASS